MMHQCLNKPSERKNGDVLKFFDLSASNLNDAAEPKYFSTRLHISRISKKQVPPVALYPNEFIF